MRNRQKQRELRRKQGKEQIIDKRNRYYKQIRQQTEYAARTV